MSRITPFRAALVGGLVASVAIASADCKARTYTTCTGLCENVLPCNFTYDQCITFCTDVQTRCEGVGRPAVFQAYVACTTDAGFSCDLGDAGDGGDASDVFIPLPPPDASEAAVGVPVANAPCGIQQADLVQCLSYDGQAPFDVAEDAYDLGKACPDAGSCLECCAMAYPKGATLYREAVLACVCGEGGVHERVCLCTQDGGGATHPCSPSAACGGEICAARGVQPTPGDPCDQCLATVLDEQAVDAGPCVIPVTKQCNEHPECAEYANCLSQAGCTN